MGILLNDSMSIVEANEYENHHWLLYEHCGAIKREKVFANSKENVWAEVIWLHHSMLLKIWWFNGSIFVNFVEKNNNTIGITN